MNNLLFDIDNIFFPSQCIDDPKWFAGRKLDIEKALHSLCTSGASILVYGERTFTKNLLIIMMFISLLDCVNCKYNK